MKPVARRPITRASNKLKRAPQNAGFSGVVNIDDDDEVLDAFMTSSGNTCETSERREGTAVGTGRGAGRGRGNTRARRGAGRAGRGYANTGAGSEQHNTAAGRAAAKNMSVRRRGATLGLAGGRDTLQSPPVRMEGTWTLLSSTASTLLGSTSSSRYNGWLRATQHSINEVRKDA